MADRMTYLIRHKPSSGEDIPISTIVARSESEALARFFSGLRHKHICPLRDDERGRRYQRRFYAVRVDGKSSK